MSGASAAARLAHTRLLHDLAKGGVEPQDPAIRKKYEDFRVEVTKQALKILRERIPVKILHFNQEVNCEPGEAFLHTNDLKAFVPPTSLPAAASYPETASTSAETECSIEVEVSSTLDAEEPQRKTRKVDPSIRDIATDHSVTTLPQPQRVYFERAPTHAQVVEMGQKVRQEALELIEMVGTVKLWIQLNIPRIEDGNNFGVAIQEEAIQELGRVEDAAFALCDGTKYHTARAKLISKVVKYPNLADYTQSVLETDQKEWLHLKISLIDMRNSYSMLYDLLHKNWEKVVKPRASEGNVMVM